MITVDNLADELSDPRCLECSCALTPENQMTRDLRLKNGPGIVIPLLLCVECIDGMREGEIGKVYQHLFTELQNRLIW